MLSKNLPLKCVCYWQLVALCRKVFSVQLQAQQKFADDLHAMVNVHAGYTPPEYPFPSAITNDYVRSVEVCLYKETSGFNELEQLYAYPSYGASFFYSTLGNDEVYGREYALTGFFRMNLFARNRFRIFNRTGVGLSYVTRKFDLESNYLNVAVGSKVNVHFNLRFGVAYELSDKVSLNAGASFDKWSNANSHDPNLGINYLTGYTGLSYGLGKKRDKQIHELKPLLKAPPCANCEGRR